MTNQSVTWVIERHIFEEKEELALIEEVKKQGGEVKVINPLSKDNFNYDSFNIAKKTRQQAWYPEISSHKKNFNCYTYYTYWGKWIIFLY